MILPASYLNGLAPRDGQPLYPSLWTGCVGAWAPCLGPTGLVLRDWSRFQNHGTLTNMTLSSSWATSFQRYGLSFDGINDIVTVANNDRLDGMSQLSVSAWVYIRSAGGGSFGRILEKNAAASYILLMNSATNSIGFYVNAVQSVSGTIPSPTNRWLHVVGVYNGSNVIIYVGGIAGTPQSVTGVVATSTANLNIGNRTGGDRGFDGFIDDIRMYNRVITPPEIALLSLRRGISYEMNFKRKNSFITASTNNRRRRLLIGA